MTLTQAPGEMVRLIDPVRCSPYLCCDFCGVVQMRVAFEDSCIVHEDWRWEVMADRMMMTASGIIVRLLLWLVEGDAGEGRARSRPWPPVLNRVCQTSSLKNAVDDQAQMVAPLMALR